MLTIPQNSDSLNLLDYLNMPRIAFRKRQSMKNYSPKDKFLRKL